MTEQPATIDDYIASFPADVRGVLEETRRRIRAAAPQAGETISYGMPTLTIDGRHLVYFAGWKRHLALYAVPRLDDPLEQELAPYRAVKDTVRFPLKDPIPYELIERLVVLLVTQREGGRTRP